MAEITILFAFAAGILSFLSPCILPLIPAFLAYLSGTTIEESKETKKKLNVVLNTLFFVLGFSVIFSLIGVLLNSILIGISYDLRIWLSRMGGVVIIALGLYLLGVLKIPFLSSEHKFRPKKFKLSYLTSFIFGAAFAAGWTPCVGAVLGTILTLAITSPGIAFALLFAYSIGLGIPFILSGIFLSQTLILISKAGNLLKYFNIIMGIILIVIGILVFTNNLAAVANLQFASNLLSRFK